MWNHCLLTIIINPDDMSLSYADIVRHTALPEKTVRDALTFWVQNDILRAETPHKRAAEIREIAAKFGGRVSADKVNKAAEEGRTVSDFRDDLLESLATDPRGDDVLVGSR